MRGAVLEDHRDVDHPGEIHRGHAHEDQDREEDRQLDGRQAPPRRSRAPSPRPHSARSPHPWHDHGWSNTSGSVDLGRTFKMSPRPVERIQTPAEERAGQECTGFESSRWLHRFIRACKGDLGHVRASSQLRVDSCEHRSALSRFVNAASGLGMPRFVWDGEASASQTTWARSFPGPINQTPPLGSQEIETARPAVFSAQSVQHSRRGSCDL